MSQSINPTADRIAQSAQRGTYTQEQQEEAVELLLKLQNAVEGHGITLDDLDYLVDVPGNALMAIAFRDRAEERNA